MVGDWQTGLEAGRMMTEVWKSKGMCGEQSLLRLVINSLKVECIITNGTFVAAVEMTGMARVNNLHLGVAEVTSSTCIRFMSLSFGI